jgi:hypothetical protein
MKSNEVKTNPMYGYKIRVIPECSIRLFQMIIPVPLKENPETYVQNLLSRVLKISCSWEFDDEDLESDDE